MMIKQTNPWETMSSNSQRRVDKNLNYDFFWIRDIDGRYGFCIESKDILKDNESNINLKGITLKKVSDEGYTSRLYMILNDNKDYEIFIVLCQDLISIANKYDNNKRIISEVEDRLKRWQQLLKRNMTGIMTIERQMGLFSELVCLKNIIASEIGINEAIVSWVGPDFDKQDFSTDLVTIEVKSYKSTKGEIIYISSFEQLKVNEKPLYLVAYGLTISEKGLSIMDMIDTIQNRIEDRNILELFKLKLFDYGHIDGIANNTKLSKFIIDKESIYYINEKFPKICSNDVSHKIVSIKYGIDLYKCEEFKVDEIDLLSVGETI